MTRPILLAAAAGVLTVPAIWELLIAAEQIRHGNFIRRLLVPLRSPEREPTLDERRRLAIVGTVTIAAAGALVSGPVLAVGLAAGAPLLITQLLAFRRRRWRAELASGLPDAARALADAIAAGHTIAAAFAAAARGGVSGAARDELAIVAERTALGMELPEALARLRERADDPGWDALVAAVLLQREVGGDLAGLLRLIADSVQEGRRGEQQARGLTTQSRATAMLVAGAPIIAVIAAEVLSPGTLSDVATDGIATALMVCGLILGVVAFVVMGRLTRGIERL